MTENEMALMLTSVAVDMQDKDVDDILDKIRAEIEEQKECRCFDDDDMVVYRTGLNDAIYIIDKYKAESEDKE